MLSAFLPIISLVLCVILAYLLRNSLRKHATYYYWGSVLVVAFTVALVYTPYMRFVRSHEVLNFIYAMISRGALATSLFIIVMYVGAFSKKSKFYKSFLPIRGELAIIACIFTLLHNIIYGRYYFITLFMHPERLATYRLIATMISLVLILIMLPLFITSFKSIRRKIHYKRWKKLHKLAYLFFPLIIIHVLLLYYFGYIKSLEMHWPSVLKYEIGIIFYLAILVVYYILKYKNRGIK